ncbi:MAG: hydrogenase maturation nickel metallochaperone HypA [Planctomycetales bacterium]
MHETSLVESLLQQVAQLQRAHGGAPVEAVHVEIGPLAGVEPLLVQSAFAQLAVRHAIPDARLEVAQTPLVARCSCCGEFEVVGFRFRCPQCGSAEVPVVRGDAFRLMSITLREEN